MSRVSFETVEARVEEMYDFSITDPTEIDRRCLDIQDFIRRCGWNLDDYIRRMMGYDAGQVCN